MKIKTILALLLCSLMLCPMAAFAETLPPEGQGLIITEICYNPAWREGDEQIEDNADVFSYVEIYNPTDRSISLAEFSLFYRADDGTRLESGALICAGDTPTLGAGEIAVIVLYNEKNWTVLGLDNTADCAAAVWETFTDLHGIADVLDQNHLYIATNKDFKPDKDSANATMELYCGGFVQSVTYDAVYYNRNNRAVVFGTDGSCMGAAMPRPGKIYDNQIPDNQELVPNKQTIGIKAVEYNICASGVPNDDEDIPTIADRQDEAFALIEAEDPDLIVLCEVNYAWKDYIVAFCEKNGYTAYGNSAAGRDFHGALGKQKWDLTSLILWKTDRFEVLETGRFWCSSTPDKKGSTKWDGGLVSDMGRCVNHALLKDKASGVEFLFVGAHLDAKTDQIRTLSAELIYERTHSLAGDRPIIMLGDWNANQTRDSYAILTSGDLADARYRTTDTDLHGTFNKWGEYSADIQTRLPIDHCFITKHNVWVDSYKQIGGPAIENVPHPSDHNMTVFSLQISTGEELPETTEAESTAPIEGDNDMATSPMGCKAAVSVGVTATLLATCALVMGKRKRK